MALPPATRFRPGCTKLPASEALSPVSSVSRRPCGHHYPAIDSCATAGAVDECSCLSTILFLRPSTVTLVAALLCRTVCLAFFPSFARSPLSPLSPLCFLLLFVVFVRGVGRLAMPRRPYRRGPRPRPPIGSSVPPHSCSSLSHLLPHVYVLIYDIPLPQFSRSDTLLRLHVSLYTHWFVRPRPLGRRSACVPR